MELILLQKVANLGNIGDRVRVKSGYGRNHLLPKGKATLATAQNTNLQRRAEDLRLGANGFSAAGFAMSNGGPSYSGSLDPAAGAAEDVGKRAGHLRAPARRGWDGERARL